jgi:hypothetical protein
LSQGAVWLAVTRFSAALSEKSPYPFSSRFLFLSVALRSVQNPEMSSANKFPGTGRNTWNPFWILAFTSICLFAADSSKESEPRMVTTGAPGEPPSDAIVLFRGTDLDSWKNEEGAAAHWRIEGGAMVATAPGGIQTREEFGDIQLHAEWASPAEVKGEGQGRGNSGIYFQGRYEIQVLDSYDNKTYPNGQAASFYGHSAPLVNASRKPGEWQSYDIVFHAPKRQTDGSIKPGTFTVFHNGVLVQDNTPIAGEATTAAKLSGIASKGPLFLQDHGNPVRYRNIWLRKLN